MTYCDSMIKYANGADWAAHGLFILLGMWKLWNLMSVACKWAERKIDSDKESGK